MNKRIVSFIISILFLIISAVISYVCYSSLIGLPRDGIEVIALIFTLPLFFLTYLMLAFILILGVIASIKAIMSDVVAIRVISIILLILYVALICLNIIFVVSYLV